MSNEEPFVKPYNHNHATNSYSLLITLFAYLLIRWPTHLLTYWPTDPLTYFPSPVPRDRFHAALNSALACLLVGGISNIERKPVPLTYTVRFTNFYNVPLLVCFFTCLCLCMFPCFYVFFLFSVYCVLCTYQLNFFCMYEYLSGGHIF